MWGYRKHDSSGPDLAATGIDRTGVRMLTGRTGVRTLIGHSGVRTLSGRIAAAEWSAVP